MWWMCPMDNDLQCKFMATFSVCSLDWCYDAMSTRNQHPLVIHDLAQSYTKIPLKSLPGSAWNGRGTMAFPYFESTISRVCIWDAQAQQDLCNAGMGQNMSKPFKVLNWCRLQASPAPAGSLDWCSLANDVGESSPVVSVNVYHRLPTLQVEPRVLTVTSHDFVWWSCCSCLCDSLPVFSHQTWSGSTQLIALQLTFRLDPEKDGFT